MADDSGDIEISVVLNDGQVVQGFAKIQKAGADAADGVASSWGAALAPILAVVAAFESIVKVKDLFSDAITSAQTFDKAVQSLNVSLGVAGRYTDAASAQFQQLAEKIEATTTVSADTVIGLERLAVTYTQTNEQAMKLTETAVNLAAATGTDVNEAISKLSQTLSGHAGRLQLLFPALQQFTAAQLRAGAAVDYFNNRFAGAASAQVNTFDGKLAQLSNSFNELLKSVGQYVTQSPTVVAAIGYISQSLNSLATNIRSASGGDFFAKVIPSLISFARGLVTYVLAPMEYIVQVVNAVVGIFVTGFRTILVAVAYVGDVIDGFLNSVVKLGQGIYALVTNNQALAKSLRDAKDGFGSIDLTATNAAFADLSKSANGTYDSINKLGESFKFSEGVDSFLEGMQRAVDNAPTLKANFADLGAGADQFSGQVQNIGQTFTLMVQGALGALSELQRTGTKVFQDLGGQAIKTFSNGIASGMAAIGKALVKGQNIFQAFAGAMLSALGQAAIQMGATYILLGIARGFSSYGFDPTAEALIGVGSALSVAGGAMMAIGDGVSGSGSSSPSTDASAASGASTASGGGYTASDQSAASSPGSASDVQNNPQANIAVHIHGDVLDSNETGLRIVELINNAFNTSGARVTAT